MFGAAGGGIGVGVGVSVDVDVYVGFEDVVVTDFEEVVKLVGVDVTKSISAAFSK